MSERTFNWKNKDIRAQVDVVDSKLLPTLLLRNALVLNPYVKQWLKKKHLDLSGPHCLCGS